MSTKFVIVGAARTGSTLLVKTLDSIDGVLCHGELLNNDGVRGYADGFDAFTATPQARKLRSETLDKARQANQAGFIASALDRESTATGFKALYSAFFDPRWAPSVEYLLSDGGIKFVHLVRHNDLRRYISEQILNAGGTNHSAVGGRSNRSVTVEIDVRAFTASHDAILREIDHTRRLLANHTVLELRYEDLSAAPGQVIAQTCEYLGITIDPASVEPALQKVGAPDLRDSVSNYDELMANSATRAMLLSH